VKWKSASEFQAQTGVVTADSHFLAEYAERTVFFHTVTLGRLATELPLAAGALRKALTGTFDWSRLDGPASTVIAGTERMLLLSPALAATPKAQTFVDASQTFSAIRRDESSAERAKRSTVSDLADAADALAKIVWATAPSTGTEIDTAAKALSADLRRYFREASDCFSVQLDGLGVFSALRGLEATLRAVAEKKGVSLERVSKNNTITKEPLHEEDLRDIIEAATRLRWVDTGMPLIDKPTRSLLQTLRDHRNAAAHPRPGIDDDGGKEVALLAGC
jgi:hypothetical protein